MRFSPSVGKLSLIYDYFPSYSAYTYLVPFPAQKNAVTFRGIISIIASHTLARGQNKKRQWDDEGEGMDKVLSA